tara:strand:+ start:156 stop:743 length:588 start_codon:yes stop_codon:yes gene_type:complete
MKSHLEKLKVLINAGGKRINQALNLAESLYAENSKEMGEIENLLSDKIVLKHYNGNPHKKIGDNEWGVYINTYDEDYHTHPVDIFVPLVGEVDLAYRKGKIIVGVTLDWGWKGLRGQGISMYGRNFGNTGSIKPTRTHIKLIEKALDLPLRKEVVLNGIKDIKYLNDQANNVLAKIKHPLTHSLTYNAAEKMGEE